MPDACGTSSRRKSFNSASALERFCTWRNTVASSITVVSILTGIGGTGATKKSRVRKVSRWYVSLVKTWWKYFQTGTEWWNEWACRQLWHEFQIIGFFIGGRSILRFLELLWEDLGISEVRQEATREADSMHLGVLLSLAISSVSSCHG